MTIERLGKPAALVITRHCEYDARFNARQAGLPDIAVAVVPTAHVPAPEEIASMKLGETVADEIVRALTQRPSAGAGIEEPTEKTLQFSGNSYDEAVEAMEQHFLRHCWSDGLPLVPPTPARVKQMLAGTDLSPTHVVGKVEPGGGLATVEKIAVNAVMAGCLPPYLSVVIAAVEATTDARFDLRGVQATAGLVSPLLIVSGQEVVQRLNINDGFGAVGPGWRANTTIGRAIRLVMINLGYGWPGKTDMKSIGSPWRNIAVLAENESAYEGSWEPLRVAEGFRADQATVSVMPATTFQPDTVRPNQLSAESVYHAISLQGRSRYDRRARFYGKDNLVLLNPDAFSALRKEKVSRRDAQKALQSVIKTPCAEFFEAEIGDGKGPVSKAGSADIPESIVQACRRDPNASVPSLARPENVKIVVAGGPGPAMFAYVGTWGPAAYFTTKAIRLPADWKELADKYQAWQTPVQK